MKMTKKHVELGHVLLIILLCIVSMIAGTRAARLQAKAAMEEEEEYMTAAGGAIQKSYLTGPGDLAEEAPVWTRNEKMRKQLMKEAIPSQWDSRNLGKTGTIRNQGDLSTCWAFASLSGVEAYLLPDESQDFSVDHMITYCGFGDRAKSGGTFAMALAYLTAWRGPVYEWEDPYNDGTNNPMAKVRYHLQEAQLLNNDPAAVKLAVLRYGAVQSSMYADEGILVTDDTTSYFNSECDSYYYDGPEKTNHDVLIIGWDDNYSAKNFVKEPPVNGAFLCQNSWGSEFGEGGYFYVSYADTRIINFAMTYSRIDPPGVYDSIYQHDDLGWVAQMGFDEFSAWGANVFTARGDEKLAAVGFYAVQPGTSYEVYVELDPDTTAFGERQLLAEGTFRYAGFYTVDLDQKISLEQGQKFALIIRLSTTSRANQLAAEAEENGARAVVNSRESYISADGEHWYDASLTLGCNLCLKGYTTED